MTKKLKQSIPYILVILAIILPWFLKPGYLFLTDNVWGPVINLDWHNSWFFLNLIVKALSFIFSVAFLEKIFISSILALILLGGRFFVKSVYKEASSSLVFILSLFALFNPFVYDRALYGQFGMIASYGFMLFALAYLYKAWQSLDFRNLNKAALFTALALMFSLHFIFLLVPFYLLFLIALLFKKDEFFLKKLLIAIVISVFIVIIINANWLFALASGSSATASFIEQGISRQDLAAFATSGKTPSQTFSNVLLMSGFWGKDQFRYLDLTQTPGWQRSFILLTPIIIYGFYVSFKKNKTLALALLFIFAGAVTLAVGIKSSFTGSITLFLYDHLPFYKGLREPQKWVAVIIPIYLFFLIEGTAKISEKLKSNKTLLGLLFAILIIMGAPSLLWGFNRQIKPTPYPADWYEVNQLLVNNSAQSYGCSDKILFLPWHMYLGFGWVGNIIANPAPVFFTCPVTSGTNMEWGGIYDNSLSSTGNNVDSWIKSKGQESIPAVRYIILAKEVDFSSYLWINDLSYVRLIKETPTLLVYELK